MKTSDLIFCARNLLAEARFLVLCIFRNKLFSALFPYLIICLILLPANPILAQIDQNKIDKLAANCKNSNSKNCKSLIEIALNNNDEATGLYVVSKLNDQQTLALIVSQSSLSEVRKAAIAKISDKKLLWDLILKIDNYQQIIKVFEEINDQEGYIYCARNIRNYDVWTEVLRNINDQPVLTDLIINNTYPYHRYFCLYLVNDQVILNKLVWDKSSDELNHNAILGMTDNNLLLEIIRCHPDAEVRYEAIKKVNDTTNMTAIALKDPYDKVRLEAVKRITDEKFLIRLINSGPGPKIILAALENITDQPTIINLAQSTSAKEVREAAKLKLIDQSLLMDIALTDVEPKQRDAALHKISDIDKLLNIALNAKYPDTRLSSVSLMDPGLYPQIVRESSDINVKYLALISIKDTTQLTDLLTQTPYLSYLYYRSRFIDNYCPGKVRTNMTVESWLNRDFQGTIDYKDDKQFIWCNGAIHTWKNTSANIRDAIDSINSDPDDPLCFMVNREKGYVFLQGKGTVSLKNGQTINYPRADETGVEAIKWQGAATWFGLKFTITFTSNADMSVFANVAIKCTCINGTASVSLDSERLVFPLENGEFQFEAGAGSKGTAKLLLQDKKITGHYVLPSEMECNNNKTFRVEGDFIAFAVKD